MFLRKFLKLKEELVSFDLIIQQIDLKIQQIDLKMQQQEVDLHVLMLDMKKEVQQPLFSNEGCKEDNEVDWDLPPKFHEYKDEQEEH